MTNLRYTTVTLIIGVGLLLPQTTFGQRPAGQQQQAQPARPPLIVALDTNGDSIISAEEIANAYQSLKTLDRNGDGTIAADEFRPSAAPGQGQRPGNGGGQQGGGPDQRGAQQGQGQRGTGQGQGPRGGAEGGQQRQGPRAGGQGGRGQRQGQGQGRRGQGQGQGAQRQRPPRTPIVLTEGQLPDTDAHLPDGTPIKVRDLIKGKYTVIKTGCLTCPEFLISYKELEALAADYTKKDVQFYYIYQSLRHPEREGYVQPQNTKERLMHVAEAKERLGTKVPWIMDTIDDSFRTAMRTNSNSVFVISPDSEIVYAADRMNGDGFRRELGNIVGPIENPTSPRRSRFPRSTTFSTDQYHQRDPR